jgi:hypothetical protein
MITPPNPRPQILSGQFPIHIKRSKANPWKDNKDMRAQITRKIGSSLKIVPHICLVTNDPGSFRDPFLTDELNVRKVVARQTGARR